MATIELKPRNPRSSRPWTKEEILSSYTVVDGCWRWKGGFHKGTGYGTVKVANRNITIHRYFYENLKGPINSEVLDHLCRNRWCCNPEHLDQVTQKINTHRGISPRAKLAAREHCDCGREFTDRIFHGKVVGRMCKPCKLARDNARRKSRAAELLSQYLGQSGGTK